MSKRNDGAISGGTGEIYNRKQHLRLVVKGEESWFPSGNSQSTGGGHGGGSEGGGDMDKKLSLLELRVLHVETNISEIKNSLNSIDTKVSTVQRDLSGDVKWLIGSGVAALFAVYILIGNSLDKEISTLSKQISLQISTVSDQIKELKVIGNDLNKPKIELQEEKK